jgi:flagellar protein FlbT
MMYLDESEAAGFYDEFARRVTEFMSVVRQPEVLADCVDASRLVMSREYYKALMACRKLIEYEDEVLGHVGTGLPASRAAG